MPLVRISLRRGKPAAYRRAVADGVHCALIDAIGIPPADRFQIITEHEDDNLIYDRSYFAERSDNTVFIEVTLRRGRPEPVKRDFYRRIVTYLAENPGLRPEDAAIVLRENGDDDWSFGKGEAQLVNPDAPPIRTTVAA